LPTAIQPIRLTSAPAKNEIARNEPEKRRTNESGPFKTSPMRMSQPDPVRGPLDWLRPAQPDQKRCLNRGREESGALSGAKRVAPRFSKTAAEHRRQVNETILKQESQRLT
jgi:hypothetical protein